MVDVDESTTILSELLERAEAGEDVVITRAGKPVVRLVPVEPWAGTRPGRGNAKGRMWIARATSMTLCRMSRQHSPARRDAFLLGTLTFSVRSIACLLRKRWRKLRHSQS